MENARDLGMNWNRVSVGSSWMFRFTQRDNAIYEMSDEF
jgi:hypothetical protein